MSIVRYCTIILLFCFSASRIKEVMKSWKIEDEKEETLGVSSRGTQEIIIHGPFILSLKAEKND